MTPRGLCVESSFLLPFQCITLDHPWSPSLYLALRFRSGGTSLLCNVGSRPCNASYGALRSASEHASTARAGRTSRLERSPMWWRIQGHSDPCLWVRLVSDKSSSKFAVSAIDKLEQLLDQVPRIATPSSGSDRRSFGWLRSSMPCASGATRGAAVAAWLSEYRVVVTTAVLNGYLRALRRRRERPRGRRASPYLVAFARVARVPLVQCAQCRIHRRRRRPRCNPPPSRGRRPRHRRRAPRSMVRGARSWRSGLTRKTSDPLRVHGAEGAFAVAQERSSRVASEARARPLEERDGQ